MNEWRHFGASLELAASVECGVDADGADARWPSGHYDAALSDNFRGDLFRLIEGEILPRLMLAHSGSQSESREQACSSRPSRSPSKDIEGLCALLLDPVGDDLTASVLTLLEDRRSLETLLLHLLVPTARRLGELWEKDECDFVEVTVAIGRLQTVTRELCARLESRSVPAGGRSVLLLPCPGETHTFALSIVASFFRESGWTVTTAGAGSEMTDLVRHEWFDVIGLTLSCDVLLPAFAESIRELRRASCNRNVRMIAGGAFFTRHPNALSLVGADAVAEDGRIAPLVAESLLEKRARAC